VKPAPPVSPQIKKKEEQKKAVFDGAGDVKLDAYKLLLRTVVAKPKISVDEKRLMREYRKGNNISEEDHYKLLSFFGWSHEEYDDGEKRDDECDLAVERKILMENGNEIIKIKKEDTLNNKEFDLVYSRVISRFFTTMSAAQGNFTLTGVDVIVNSETRKKYNQTKLEFKERAIETTEEWVFHGTTRDSIGKIAMGNFLHPDDIKKLPKAKKQKKVKLLDEGYFGKGIYFSVYSDYALWYSDERKSDQVLLCKVLTGKVYQCPGRIDGQGCQAGFHSHLSPKKNEIIIFEPKQILPLYVVTFKINDEEDRSQED